MSKLVDDAMELVPSRVIVWTTPYKQLYKDPALVVALGATVCQIDELHQDGMEGRRSAEGDSSLLRLVKASIEDADAKYAALWKLYVFISDGLFYSGVLGKLARTPDRKYGIDDHKHRLEECQAFVVKAVRVVNNNWRDIRTACAKVEGRGQRLIGSMEREEFRDLVDDWKKALTDMGESTRELVRRVCRVDVENYAHSWDGSRNQMDKCRDVRYKVDATAEAAWGLAKRKEAGESEKALVSLLEGLQVESKSLSQLEFRDLVNLLDERALGKLKELRSAWPKGNGAWEFVKALLWGAFPRSDAKVSIEVEMGDQSRFGAVDTGFPRTKEELEEWLKVEAEVWRPHARREFLDAIEPMAGLIWEDVDEGMRAEAMRDVRVRLRNEQRKLFNHIRRGEVLAILRRRWKRDKEA